MFYCNKSVQVSVCHIHLLMAFKVKCNPKPNSYKEYDETSKAARKSTHQLVKVVQEYQTDSAKATTSENSEDIGNRNPISAEVKVRFV